MNNLLESFNPEYYAKVILYVIAGALPIFFLPFHVGVEFGREMVFGALILIAAIFWLLNVLIKGEIRFQLSPVLYAVLFFFIVLTLGAVFSKAPLYSLALSDVSGEKLSTMALAIVLMVLAGSVFRTQHDAAGALLIFIFAGGVSALITAFQLVFGVSIYRFVTPLAAGTDFNAIGTINGLSLFFATLLSIGAGFLTSSWMLATKKWVRYGFLASLAFLFVDILLINFRTSWFILLGGAIFLFGLMFRGKRMSFGAEGGFNWRYWSALVLIAVSVLMVFVRGPIFSKIVVPAEVSPSFQATLNIGGKVFQEGVKSTLLGSGLGTFGLDWSLYRNPGINQTQFWGVRFNQGFSFVSTLVPTVGVLGTLAFLLFIGMALFLFLKAIILSSTEESELASSILVGFVAVLIGAFLYPANLTMILLLFMSCGLLSFILAERGGAAPQENFGTEPGWRQKLKFWRQGIRGKEVRFESQWAVFLSSLLAVFFVSISVWGVYYEIERFRELSLRQRGFEDFARGSMDGAIGYFERASAVSPKNFRNQLALMQLRTEKIKNLIQKASAGENVQQEFQATVAAAIQSSQAALNLMPNEPILWRTQGALYEVMIPFINGSERLAFESYKRATELDPVNPAIWTGWGRAGLVFADRLLFLSNQSSGAEKNQLLQARVNTLQDVAVAFQKAIEVKSDYAPAHFLLSQTAIRLGDLRSAIQATENTKITAPFDIGVAFQLGLLYYQAGDLAKAQAELERAISLNESYSNARYFLGLIHDRKRERAKAIDQFERILALNPGNQEVQNILVNLRAGRDALSGIVPPARPPQDRIEPPVPDTGQGGQ